MFRPHYQIYTQGSIGTRFEKKDVLDPVKSFLDRHGIPSEIVVDVSFCYNCIYIELKKGSVDKYGNEMKFAFDALPSPQGYGLLAVDRWKEDLIECWAPFLEDIVEANNKHKFEQFMKGELNPFEQTNTEKLSTTLQRKF